LTATVNIIGAGVVGLCTAAAFVKRGCRVTVTSLNASPDQSLCSWWAGGMLAPYCEMESAEPLIGELGLQSMEYWAQFACPSVNSGTLVVAAPRDTADLNQFSRKTREWQALDTAAIETLEPELSGRFKRALYYPDEAHLNPRTVLQALHGELKNSVNWQHANADSKENNATDWVVDCRGLAAADTLPELRGVKGEMLIVRAPDVTLSRPVRLLHPRIPLYVVPRADHRFAPRLR